MVWQILHGFDPAGGQVDLRIRSPFLEFQALLEVDKNNNEGQGEAKISNSIRMAEETPSPR